MEGGAKDFARNPRDTCKKHTADRWMLTPWQVNNVVIRVSTARLGTGKASSARVALPEKWRIQARQTSDYQIEIKLRAGTFNDCGVVDAPIHKLSSILHCSPKLHASTKTWSDRIHLPAFSVCHSASSKVI